MLTLARTAAKSKDGGGVIQLTRQLAGQATQLANWLANFNSLLAKAKSMDKDLTYVLLSLNAESKKRSC